MSDNKNSKARIEANNRYNAKAYDRINIAVPKGTKDIIQAEAKKNGESVNAFINRLIDTELHRLGVDSVRGCDSSALPVDGIEE